MKTYCHIFICRFRNKTNANTGKHEFYARNKHEASTHFKFFYPKKILLNVSKQ